ncbi:MAG: RsmB/NOP family class I SAM-dependent RNA methyltransferase [Rhodobacteraceae bacterium]|nr:MAG: RsmB/NOP family class I SAM-dependent RNA methyltransferase [Paracoccaceae bacterium]
MTPAARLQAAIDVLAAIDAGASTAERALAAWGRASRYAGARDRAAVSDLVYQALRRWRSQAWRAGGEGPRAAILGGAAEAGEDVATLFAGLRHGPSPLTDAERTALTAARPAPAPVRLDYPDWLDAPLRESLGPCFEASMAALRDRAPVDLRVNALKATVAEARAALAAEGVETTPVDVAPGALRAAPGAPVARTRAFAEGLVELQDAASQAAAALADARAGETVLDFCAGAGGKALALAAAMGGRGRVFAHDAEPRRMRDLPGRAARAGARVETLDAAGLEALRGACDLVFVDAPCSGSGSWRRDPLGKWRLTPSRLAALAALQAEILRSAAQRLRPGGRLAYATCSVLTEETDAPVAAAFGDAARTVASLTLTPADGADGFSCRILQVAPSP